ncbi:hypothetical protein FRC04_004809 [Tulasnella sp. 424]|nr:hypothetical protein FRC04_004809 [Tulasnella sp. 424]KAG8965138.1 hypothetical protein FRC05_003350 [Tulasnella sp. 425]
MDRASQPNQSLIPPSEKDLESILAILLDKVAETNGISLPNLPYLTGEGKFLTTEEATLGKRALATAYGALVRSSNSMVNKLAVKLNSTAPIHQLPSEILSEVLCWTLEPDNQYARTLHQLALVGRRWYSHVKASTELWTTVRTDQRADDVRLVLRKSKGRLLRVIVKGSPDYGVSRAVEAESLRWESFEFCAPQYHYNQPSWTLDQFPDAPHLRDASFQFTIRSGAPAVLPDSLYGYKLRHVRLSRVEFDWGALLETGPVTLDIDNPDTIPSPERLCELLSECPQLVQFRLVGWRRAIDESCHDTPLNWTHPQILLPSLTSLELKYLPPQYFLLLGRIYAPNCATVEIGDQDVLLEDSLVQEMPPLLCKALVPTFRSARLINIQVTRRRGLRISLTGQAKRLPIQLNINTSRPVETLNVVGGLLKSRQIRTPVTLDFEEQVSLMEKTLGNLPTLRTIHVVGGAMCEDLMRCLAHSEVDTDGKRKWLCLGLEYVRMSYDWEESVPSSHCALLLDLARLRWGWEHDDDPWDRPILPEEFAIFTLGEVSAEFKQAVLDAQSVAPAIELVENEERFFMSHVDLHIYM